MQVANNCSKFNVIILINQTICEERVAIYEAEKDTIKKRNGKIVTFVRKRTKQPPLLDLCWKGVTKVMHK